MAHRTDGEVLEKTVSTQQAGHNRVLDTSEQRPHRPRKPKKEKLHIAMPAQLKDRLDQLAEATNADGPSDVIRAALVLYDLAFQEHSRGSDLLIRTKDGDVERLRIFL